MDGEVLPGAGERFSRRGRKLLCLQARCGRNTQGPPLRGSWTGGRQLDLEFVFFVLCHLLNLEVKG